MKSCWSIAVVVAWLLHKLQAVLADGAVQATGFLALFYSAVLFTEGIGVYMQQRWAELLMIFATASLIPIEIRHLWHRPGLVGALILLANCFIVWFLYRVLKRDKRKTQIARRARTGRDRLGALFVDRDTLGTAARVEYFSGEHGDAVHAKAER